ncbi:TetR/AcrR family transcriptional regulator [Opitutus sp. ER46]|uniref:TetR/AcrR family transcriptional regulator n=1 Tax=Opitutus sp. ER46 TaxID=2161864 RepID=UPI000D305B2D|nr:TetR/AcrR family transcriptional regulator [Opitutus sp. ER46]PTX91454.1 hypothetical protein DB354_16325 [Opitutus sp. ER46]
MVSRPAYSADTVFDQQPPERARLLHAARRLMLTYGYQAFTMDQLAHELGVSKKTLYVHFPSKDAIVNQIIDLMGASIQGGMKAVLADPTLTFPQRISGVVDVASANLARLSPAVLRDLERFAPATYRKIEDIRSQTIPVVFGQLVRMGIAEGKVRADVDPAFAAEFWLQAIRGLVQPAVLERTQLTLPQTLQRGLHLFFSGLLTPAGRKEYEKST